MSYDSGQIGTIPDGSGGWKIVLPSGQSFVVYDHSATAIFTATDGSPDVASVTPALTLAAGHSSGAGLNSAPLLLQSSSGTNLMAYDVAGTQAWYNRDGNAAFAVLAGATPSLVLYHSLELQGSISYFNNIATAGLGVPAIYQVGNGVGATTAQTVTYTPPATAGCYIVTVAIQVTTAGTSTIPTLSYHDASGNTVTSQPMSMKQVSTVNAPVVSIVATGYWAYDYPVSVDNSGSPITVVITPTGSTFNYEVFIRQVR